MRGTQSHSTLPWGVRTSSARWPIANDGLTPTAEQAGLLLPQLRAVVGGQRGRCRPPLAAFGHRLPLVRADRAGGGRCSVSGYCIAHRTQIHADISPPSVRGCRLLAPPVLVGGITRGLRLRAYATRCSESRRISSAASRRSPSSASHRPVPRAAARHDRPHDLRKSRVPYPRLPRWTIATPSPGTPGERPVPHRHAHGHRQGNQRHAERRSALPLPRTAAPPRRRRVPGGAGGLEPQRTAMARRGGRGRGRRPTSSPPCGSPAPNGSGSGSWRPATARRRPATAGCSSTPPA